MDGMRGGVGTAEAAYGNMKYGDGVAYVRCRTYNRRRLLTYCGAAAMHLAAKANGKRCENGMAACASSIVDNGICGASRVFLAHQRRQPKELSASEQKTYQNR